MRKQALFPVAAQDGQHLAGAGATGAVVFGKVVDRSLEWKNYEVTLNERNQIIVTDINHEAKVRGCFGELNS